MNATNGHLKESTELERQRMIAGGMREISPRQLAEEISALGYRIDVGRSFNYANTGNAISYQARAVSIVCKETGHCFSNIDARRDRLPELQAIRFNTFCFVHGRIWEL